MRNRLWVLALSIAVPAFLGCGGNGASGGDCGDAAFIAWPNGTGPSQQIDLQICYHSQGSSTGCLIYNYDIPPIGDWENYTDIHFDPGCGTNEVDGSFVHDGTRYTFSGTLSGEVPLGDTIPSVLISEGTYMTETGAEQGDYDLLW